MNPARAEMIGRGLREEGAERPVESLAEQARRADRPMGDELYNPSATEAEEAQAGVDGSDYGGDH